MKLYLVEKWEATGLLEGVPEKKKEKLAVTLESMCAFLLSKAKDIHDNKLANFMFPIVRRLYNHGIVLNSSWLVEDFGKWLVTQPPPGGFYAIDHEVELVDNYVNKVVKERGQ